MAKSIRGTLIRPTPETVWDMHVFFDGVVENVSILNSTGQITTYLKGNPLTDLILIVDHYFEDDEFFESYKATAYEYLPAWITAANKQEALDYSRENGTSVILEEIDNPDLTGYVPIEQAPTPEYITLPTVG